MHYQALQFRNLHYSMSAGHQSNSRIREKFLACSEFRHSQVGEINYREGLNYLCDLSCRFIIEKKKKQKKTHHLEGVMT